MVRRVDTHRFRDVQEQYTAEEKQTTKEVHRCGKKKEDKPVPIK